MFDLGWTELLVVGIVALIVVGPKDLPKLFRTLGRFTGKMRGMAREFSRAMDDAANESGVKDMAKDFKDAANPKKMGIDRLEDAAKSFEKWQPGTETDRLSKDRAEAAKKIHEVSAKKAQARLDAEKAAKAAEAAPKTDRPDETPTPPAAPQADKA
ncbi:twin-arginine translocation protein [Dinoroseobacter shibae DFL 12 = DSM 16493]|jgi:sec-independent protein translocase protein TatB|uniref:Sec-independent protein translocase protein TatB n=1 Tax=Dinoroseobacter shibae (strain DSM 16493 / NCIMB 14021 / DFL 12) TaxID=398580 RepID=A8LIX2_DINSH|nr:Sec-independent protein translocase protein TatB [Dinoroseobacter shibae]ABV93086.1 twin-arginine translocation protein [Dinoroseobacter shibae DFL 12 = DSM 16493]URF48016.1 Sec-independent protein translocase protein TatB [Dinoroseobacter shibae]URF52325.1 Sec-independent protein translocase protein TatB [Dinoroseobacter shibae]